MIIDYPSPSQISGLRSLWKEAFGDDDAYLDRFFATGFSADRCRCAAVDGQVAAALYWFPCEWDHKPIAYLYAVATLQTYQHRGLAQKLLANTHEILIDAGYAGIILMPASSSLFSFYEKAGYCTATRIDRFSCQAGDIPLPISKISSAEYSRLRKALLPAGSVLQEGVTMAFLGEQADFYRGEDFLLCASSENGKLAVQEFLGNRNACPGILAALKVPEAVFRGPGSEIPFTMYLSLGDSNNTSPAYFGLALD